MRMVCLGLVSFLLVLVCTNTGFADADLPSGCREFISDVHPVPGTLVRSDPGSLVRDDGVIWVQFRRAMNPASFTEHSVEVTQAKYSRPLSDAFHLVYSEENKRLVLKPKHPLFNFGTGNGVWITIKGSISDITGASIGQDCTWTFRT
jgi:hypothetical protein